MKEDISKYVFDRKNCPLCSSGDLSEGLSPNINLKFPLLPVCVESPIEEDYFIPFTISICNNCGLLMLKKIVAPEILYRIFHSDGIGKVWEEHYSHFFELIKKHHKKGKILEVGAGQGKLIKKLLSNYNHNWIEVIDPQYKGPVEDIFVHEELFSEKYAENIKEQFDSIISSHTLEHFTEFEEYFKAAWIALKEGGLLFTSVPNQEINFSKGYGNQLNFEHPSVCTNIHWLYLYQKYGFRIKEISFFRDHSIQIAGQKIQKPLPYEINIKELSIKILEEYNKQIEGRIRKIREFADEKKENWIFGASNFTQPLFVYGLNENIFRGVLDNSPLKHNKRLYGTNLTCRKPEEILSGKENIRVFLNLGYYNQEVYEQIIEINSSVECVFL
ncbi:class I SAM-dependent methyltransferase [Candidatus Pacearchaeota archaeon]|nr:class I SAM-dependent methyltransferase [Candidatus Pacearchaeota archaeon]